MTLYRQFTANSPPMHHQYNFSMQKKHARLWYLKPSISGFVVDARACYYMAACSNAANPIEEAPLRKKESLITKRRALLWRGEEYSITDNIRYTANWPFLEFNAPFHKKQKIDHDVKLHNCSVFDRRVIFIGFGMGIETSVSIYCLVILVVGGIGGCGGFLRNTIEKTVFQLL